MPHITASAGFFMNDYLEIDVVFGERDVLPGRKHQFHGLRIADHLLLVAADEVADFQVG